MYSNNQGHSTHGDCQKGAPHFLTLRSWPAGVLIAGMGVSFLPDLVSPGSPALQTIRMLGPPFCGVLLLGWWLAASRARGVERVVVMIGLASAFAATLIGADRSMLGLPTIVVTLPMGMAGLGLAGIFARRVLSWRRAAILVVCAAVGFGFSLALRGGGVVGQTGSLVLDWRFRPSPEQRLLESQSIVETTSRSPSIVDLQGEQVARWLSQPDWPGFRGPDRNATVPGTALAIDWQDRSPEKIWQIPVGSGWSSFAAAGELLFTQEQRGKLEMVVCYSATDGAEIWSCGIESRFEDSIGGPGPRATPTIAHGDLFVLGANGHLKRIQARDGQAVWTVDLRTIAQRQPPGWGFSSSPLVVDSLVIVHAGGPGNLGTLAFDIADGALRWSVPAGDHSYSSPQACELFGEKLVLMLTNQGLDLIDPRNGAVRLTHAWSEQGYRCLQPQVIGSSSVLLASASGSRLLEIAQKESQLTAEVLWTSKAIKPDFNDLVVHQDHAYGFDGAIFACVDLQTGERAWKQGRYGKGQVLLLSETGQLLIVSELGALILAQADPTRLIELGRIEAIPGKTWNHPVVVGDRLYLRNSTAAACFRLPLK